MPAVRLIGPNNEQLGVVPTQRALAHAQDLGYDLVEIKIDEHDIETKIKSASKFLDEGDKLKVTVRFRGRELAHPDRGRVLLLQVADRLKDHGIVERMPLLEGRSMIMVMNPVRRDAQGAPVPQTATPTTAPAPATAAPAPASSAAATRPAPAAAAPKPAPAAVAPKPAAAPAPAPVRAATAAPPSPTPRKRTN